MVTIRDERTRSDIPVHAVVVTAVVARCSWIVLAALTIALGALVTHFVVVGYVAVRAGSASVSDLPPAEGSSHRSLEWAAR